MFTGIIDVRWLRSKEVSLKVVNDINRLLGSQHSRAEKVDEESLVVYLKRNKVAVAWNDNERIIGMGVLVEVRLLSHTFGSIHNLVVQDGCDPIIGKRIIDLLLRGVAVEFIEANVWPKDGYAIDILTAIGFKHKPKLRYRLSARALAILSAN